MLRGGMILNCKVCNRKVFAFLPIPDVTCRDCFPGTDDILDGPKYKYTRATLDADFWGCIR